MNNKLLSDCKKNEAIFFNTAVMIYKFHCFSHKSTLDEISLAKP